jgi:uncharacterized protein YjiS (DUF1127 family)
MEADMANFTSAPTSIWRFGSRILARIGDTANQRANRRALSGLSADLLKDLGWPAGDRGTTGLRDRLPM